MRITNLRPMIHLGAMLIAFSSQAHAQIVRDFRNYRAVVPMIVADATFTAKTFNIPYKELYTVSGDHYEEVFGGIQKSIGGTGIYYGLGIQTSSYAAAWSFALSVISPWSAALWAAEIYAAEQNTQRRVYIFSIPTESEYIVTCYLKGDWDYPRNRVGIFDNNGIQVFNYDHQRSSDGTAAFRIHMASGTYTCIVALGGGSSILLHTAGNLQSVILDSPNYITWTTPFVVSEFRPRMIDYLPDVGSTYTFSVNFSGYPTNNPNLLDGTVSYSNLRAALIAPIGSLDGSPLGIPRAINKAITFIEPVISTIQSPTFNGVTATYQVMRSEDNVWTDDPETYLKTPKGKK